MILPIEENPDVTVYMHHAFIAAILENKEILRFSLQAKNPVEWSYEKVQNSDIKRSGNDFSVLSQGNYELNQGMILKECDYDEEAEVHVKYERRSGHNSFFRFVLLQKESENSESHWEKIFEFSLTNYGFFDGNQFFPYDGKEYRWLKYIKLDHCITFFAAGEDKKWEELLEYDISPELQDSDLKIGVSYDFGVDTIPLWTSMNYIQLLYNETDYIGKVWLDYYLYPKTYTDYSFGFPENYLRNNTYRFSEAVEMFGSFTKFLRWNIEHGIYTIMTLNEYFLPNRKAYHTQYYPHTNMIYGYNEEKDTFLILGMNVKLATSEIPTKDLELAYDKDSRIQTYKYDCNFTEFTMDLENVEEYLKDYLYSRKSSTKHTNLLANREGIYGINVYKALKESEMGREHFIEDVRISYLLCEHNALLRKRVQFWCKYDFIKKENAEDIMNECDQLVKASEVMKLFVIRNQKRKDHSEECFNNLDKLYEMEKKLYQKLIESLNFKK